MSTDPQRDPMVLVVDIVEIDQATAGDFETQVATCLAERPESLVIDLQHVGFLDSSGLRVLVHAYQCLSESAGTLVLRNPSPLVRRAVEAAGLDRVFAVE